jgi:hypothetical protein
MAKSIQKPTKKLPLESVLWDSRVVLRNKYNKHLWFLCLLDIKKNIDLINYFNDIKIMIIVSRWINNE